MTVSNTLGIIPARGGSKRLPRKNILPLKGLPLICWTIESAIKSLEFEKIIVSSEDSEILDIVSNYDISLHKRDPLLASDEAKVLDVCNQILSENNGYESFCVLYPTAPFRGATDITATIRLLDPPHCNFAMAVTYYDLPPHQALIEESSFLIPKWPDLVSRRSSDIGTLLVDNGSTYAAVTESFLKEQSFYGDGLKGHIMPRNRSVDLDTKEDLFYLEYLAQTITSENLL